MLFMLFCIVYAKNRPYCLSVTSIKTIFFVSIILGEKRFILNLEVCLFYSMPILTLKFRGKEHLKKELQKTLDEVTIKFIVGNIKVIPV